MSELLSCCNANLEPLPATDRDKVHQEGIWHKTSHVWLYDSEGFVYFQVRADADKLYTSASGHVMGKEDPRDAAARETKEELGIDIRKDNLELIEIDQWKFDNEKKHDHAFAHIFLYKIEKGFADFKPDPNEVSGIVKIKAGDLLGYLLGLPFKGDQFDVNGNKLKHNKDLLLMDGELSIIKYGRILYAVIKRI